MNVGLVLLLISISIFSNGCASWKVNEVVSAIPEIGTDAALSQLEQLVVPNRDQAYYLLNRGLLYFYNGHWSQAKRDLEQAKSIMDSLQAISITENSLALTTNETLRSYIGSPSDRILVHEILALCYLFSNDIESARVEILQSDTTMHQIQQKNSTVGQLASARFIAGLVFEIKGEYDDALIAYRRAYQIMKTRNELIPEALQLSLLNMSKRQSRNEEYALFKQQFGRSAELPEVDEGEWILIFFDGLVSGKIENRISVYDPGVNTMISVVLPAYPSRTASPQTLMLVEDERFQQSSVLENIEKRVREDLDNEHLKLVSTATIRAVAKFQMVQEAQEQSDMVGVLANIASVASEQADIRSWNTLPSYIQVIRFKARTDRPLLLKGKLKQLPAMNHISSGQYVLLMTNSLDDRFFSYPAFDFGQTEK